MDSLENKFEVELTATEKLAQFEKEKLSRRQALARIGFQAGAAAIAALTADELLRKVGIEMRKRAGDNKVAQQVAKEFQQAGVASALPPAPTCAHCCRQWCADIVFCNNQYQQCQEDPPPGVDCSVQFSDCINDKYYSRTTCMTAHCPSGYTCPACN
jgi:hypothetical protein